MAPFNLGHELKPYKKQGDPRRRRESPPLPLDVGASSTCDLLSLPLELQYMILAQLDLASLLTLRRSSTLYYHIINPGLLRKFFIRNGRASLALAACCNQCLCAPGLDRLVVDGTLDVYSWRSVCFRCYGNRISQDYQINPWPVIHIASGDEGYICHFCNWPVVNNGRDDGIDRLHAVCRVRRRLVLLIWILMAFLQFGLGVICAVLAWTRYKRSPGILIPSSVRISAPLGFGALSNFASRLTSGWP